MVFGLSNLKNYMIKYAMWSLAFFYQWIFQGHAICGTWCLRRLSLIFERRMYPYKGLKGVKIYSKISLLVEVRDRWDSDWIHFKNYIFLLSEAQTIEKTNACNKIRIGRKFNESLIHVFYEKLSFWVSARCLKDFP